MNRSTVTVLLFSLIGCVPTAKNLRGDHFFERGQYREAADAYQDALDSGASHARPDRALLRLSLALLLSHQGRKVRASDRAAAVKILRQLLHEHPVSSLRPVALALRQLLGENARMQQKRARNDEQLESLQAEADSCREQTETLKGALESQEGRLSSALRENEQHAAEVEDLQLRIARQHKRIEELTHALDALKRIDMQRSR